MADHTIPPTAAITYEARRQEAVSLASQIIERLNIANSPAAPHWGHVGDMRPMLDYLRDALRWAPLIECRCGLQTCDACYDPEPEPFRWDDATIADVRFHSMKEDGEL